MILRKLLNSIKYGIGILLISSFSTIVLGQTPVTVVGWDGSFFSYQGFDNANSIGTNPFANTGVAGNNGVSFIKTFGNVSNCTASDGYGDGNQIIFNLSGGGWASGSGSKGYSFSFVSTNYSALKFSGKFGATTIAGFKGARDFKMQYSLDNSVWTDISGATVQSAGNNGAGASASFTSMAEVSLPAACENKSIVYIRAIMTSNTAPDGQAVTAAGQTYIDDFKITGVVAASPTITKTGTLAAFNSCAGTASSEKNFTVAGSNLSANITVTAPTGYEVSTTSGSGFATTATLTQTSGTVVTTTIYARLTSAATGTPSGNITITSTGATTQNVAVTGTVTTVALTAASQTNIACNSGATGAATVNAATGGSSPYAYNWTPGNPTGDGTTSVSGLTAGTWTVTATDANGCTASQNFTVTQPSAISITPASQTNIACNGGANGAATVNAATGGAGGYSYNWTPGNPTGDGTKSVSGLTAGVWTCTTTDANGCTASQNFTVTQPSAILLTPASQTNVACNGGANGAATVNAATGGAGGFTYNWTPGTPTGDGTTSVSGLTVGTWTVTATDANGCTASQNFTVTQPSAISLTPASQTNIACNGGASGAATVNTATGGAGSFTYNWTPGTPTGDGTTSVSGLTAGTWTVTATDANGCTASQNFTVTQPSAISLTPASQTNIACNGGASGAATVNTATGGAGGFTYNWTPGTPTGDGTKSISGLTAGTWTVTATDANGCTATQNFTVTQPSAISLTLASQTNITCNGGANGAATVNAATGGAGGFTYNWTPGTPTGDGTKSISGLTAGTWTVTATDANSCTKSLDFVLQQPNAITGATSNAICEGDSIKIGSSIFKTSGVYIVKLVAQNGCDSILTLNLTVNPTPSAPNLTSTPICGLGTVSFTNASTRLNIPAAINKLYNAASAGSVVGSGFTTPTISQTTDFWATNTFGNCESARTKVTAFVKQSTASSITKTVCESFVFGNKTLTQSGIYKDTIPNTVGCDSVRTLNLKIQHKPIFTLQPLDQSVCVGDSVKYLSLANGDTIVYNSFISSDKVNFAMQISKSNIFKGLVGSAEIAYSGTYFVFTATNKCGIDTSNYVLFVANIVDTSVSLNSITLTSNSPNSSYQWINCDDNSSEIVGETSQSFTPTLTGNYAVIVDNGKCAKDTSACHFVELNTTGIKYSNSTNFLIYPNPATDNVNITFTESVSGTVSIVDLYGNVVATKSISGNTSNISTAYLVSGAYVVKISSDKGVAVKQLVIQ